MKSLKILSALPLYVLAVFPVALFLVFMILLLLPFATAGNWAVNRLGEQGLL